MKSIFKFIRSNVGLSVVFCISMFICISYELTMDLPELFPHADFIYNLASQLSLSYIGCYIFYIFQVYIPEKKKEYRANKIVYPMVRLIEKKMDGHINYLFNYYNITINSNCIEDSFKELHEKFNLDDLTYLFDKNGNQLTIKGYILKYLNELDKDINYIYSSVGPYMSLELVEILNMIKKSEYYVFYKMVDETKLGNQNIFQSKSNGCIASAATILINIKYEYLYEYYKIYKELHKIIDNIADEYE